MMAAEATHLRLRLLPTLLLVLTACRSDSFGPPSVTPHLPSLEPIPWHALDGGTIAFTRHLPGNAGVYIVDGAARTSTSVPYLHEPALSPDGSRLAFTRLVTFHTHADVWVMDIATGAERQLSTLEGPEHAPAWSRSGDAIIFHLHPAHAYPIPEIYRVSPAGNAPPTLIWQSAPGGAQPEGRLSADAAGAITFTNQLNALFVLESGATAPTEIYAAPPGARIYSPEWSPDGSAIAFLEIDYDQSGYRAATRVRVTSRMGTSVTTAASLSESGNISLLGVHTQHSVCWLSGSRLAFTHDASPTTAPSASIYTVAATGGSVVRLTTSPIAADFSVSCARR
jgi:Tol biopolymer transport system component